MSFRESLSCVFTPAVLYLFPALFASLAVLYAATPQERRRLAAAGLMALTSAAGLLAAVIMRGSGVDPGSGLYHIVHGVAGFLLAVAVINASAAAAFGMVFALLRLSLPALLQDLILAVAYVMAGLSVLSHEGVALTGILATSAMVTAVVAFSLQETLGNVIGGMVVHLEKAFVPGSHIRVGEDEGVVREIRWRQTTLETTSGDLVLIPNSSLMKGKVTVLGGAEDDNPGRCIQARFNVFYDRPPNEVIAAVEDALREDPPPGVASKPVPWCAAAEFTPTHIVYVLRCWLTDLNRSDVIDSDVRVRIYYALARRDIKLSIPTRAVVVTQADADMRERGRRLELARRTAALRGVGLFQTLNDEELLTLAGRLRATPFARGEVITHQGAQADCLFIVYDGEAEVQLHAEGGGTAKTVAQLKPGDFVGEMGLLAGEPRNATVVALSDVGCYRLDREGFKEVLARRPEIAESISLTLAKRKLELAAAREGLRVHEDHPQLERTRGDLLSRIRRIFALG